MFYYNRKDRSCWSHSTVMSIRLSEISIRLLIRYFPVLFFLGLIGSWSAVLMNQQPQISLLSMFAYPQLQKIFVYLFMIIPLYFFKPTRPLNRYSLMTLFMLIAELICYALSGLRFGYSPVPFLGPTHATQSFLLITANGFFLVWCFFLAEKSIIIEKRMQEEELKRISNEKKIVENRLRLLQAQIEPQFLFSTLTNIMSLRKTDPKKAKTMRMYFIQYLRTTLVKTRTPDTTVKQEMDLIQAYLDIFKISMEERLNYRIEIEHSARDLAFPSMLLQPIVENALIHGLKQKPDGGEILISARKDRQRLRVIIADTGPGVSEESEIGEGLSIVKKRIHSLFGRHGRIFTESNEPSGLRVIIEVPYV